MLVLEEVFRSQKAQYSGHFNLRFQRALSWLKKSTDLEHDPDLKLMSLWVAFQALRAEDQQDLKGLDVFLERIYHADQGGRISCILWERLVEPIVWLLQRPYFYAEFWQYKHEKISQQQWQDYFSDQKSQINQDIQQHNSTLLLARIFHCLEMLYQQISQGGISYHSALYQKYIYESCRVLSGLLPVFMYILLEKFPTPEIEKPYYPTVQVC